MGTLLSELQIHLKSTRRYAGLIDGKWGRLTEAGILLMLTDGPDTKLTLDDYRACAQRLSVPTVNVLAVSATESAGDGFLNGRPTILPEPHRFSRNTNHRFDAAYPLISYPSWGMRPYPKKQDARYDELLAMIRLDVDAGFASASYGRFQIMGENHLACGYATSWQYAEAMARDEATQLLAFENFIRNTGLLPKLARVSDDPKTCEPFCAGYNGTAFRANNYHVKISDQVKLLTREGLT